MRDRRQLDEVNRASVSVVIPCHNCSSTLQRAFDSVLRQTVRPAEVVLVDDASTDDTRKIIKDIANTYPDWVKTVFLAKNEGPSAARNAGWANATQKYVAFLDSDDEWHTRKIEIQYAWMMAHPEIMMCGHSCKEFRPGFDDVEKHLKPDVTAFNIRRLIFSNPFSTPSVMLSRSVAQRFPVEQRYCEDYYLWLSIAAAVGRLYRIESVLAWYHKPPYGAAGLSGSLWRMEKGELAAIAMLYQMKKISLFLYAIAALFSYLKYVLRWLRVGWKNR
jgi:glycosyltransferase involved in cell wall biosynthesis